MKKYLNSSICSHFPFITVSALELLREGAGEVLQAA